MVYQEIYNEKYQIQIGRNQYENDQLVKSANQKSLWFHLGGGLPSPHGILTPIEGDEISKDAIYHTAELIKNYSKYKNLPKVSVEYLPIQYVSRSHEKLGLVYLKKTPKKVTC